MKQILTLLFLASLTTLSHTAEPSELFYCSGCGHPTETLCTADTDCTWTSSCGYTTQPAAVTYEVCSDKTVEAECNALERPGNMINSACQWNTDTCDRIDLAADCTTVTDLTLCAAQYARRCYVLDGACAALTECTSFTTEALCKYIYDGSTSSITKSCFWDGTACTNFVSEGAV
jgi:hypothetical protein